MCAVLKAKLTRATLSRASKQRLPQSAPGPQFEREQEWKGKRLQNPSQRWSTIAWMQPPQDRNYPPRGTRMVAIPPCSSRSRRTQTLRQAGDPRLCKKRGLSPHPALSPTPRPSQPRLPASRTPVPWNPKPPAPPGLTHPAGTALPHPHDRPLPVPAWLNSPLSSTHPPTHLQDPSLGASRWPARPAHRV